MARPQARYVCQECGAASAKWSGRCDDCGAWNTIVEEAPAPPAGPGARARGRRSGQLVELSGLGSHGAPVARLRTGNREFDRVVGGGLVAGSALLVGGDPGIGKSTLLLQIAAAIAAAGHRVIYMSGEEAADQVRLRAARLGVAGAPVELGTATSVADIVATLERGATPRLVVIDSIQTMWDQRIDSAPGTVAQVRASAQTLIRFAKERGSIVVLVGHVTKDGQIAGPRVVEHMVDAVLYFEGDRGAPGAAVFAGIEGTRPLLVEIQALVAPSPLGTPRRAVVGTDSARLAMILAVLEARCGISLAGRDVYLNVAGGLRIQEPAADLAVAAALVSSLHGEPLDDGAVWFGEVSLSGALRPVAQSAGRLREAAKLGFTRAVLAPTDDLGEAAAGGIRLDPIEDLARLVLQLSGSGE